MTTRINVNVDQGGLLERSRQQTQSNRWGFLEEQNRKKVGVEAERQLEAKRRAEGKDANGNLYNNRLSPLPQRPDPAAWRPSGLGELPFFWYQETAATINDIVHLKLVLASGDGTQTAEYTFDTPNIYSYLSITRPALDEPPDWPFVDQFYIGGSGGVANFVPSGRIPTAARDYRESTAAAGYRTQCVNDGSPVTLTAPDGYMSALQPTRQRRKVHAIYDAGNTRARWHILPLGNKKALVVYYIRQAAFHNSIRVTETVNTTPVSLGNESIPGSSASRPVTWQTTYSYELQNEKLNQLDDEEHVCFLVGHSTVQQISTPPLLLAQLRAHVGELKQETVQGGYKFFPACVDTFFSATNVFEYPNAPSFINPATGATDLGFAFSYDEIGYQRTGESFSLNDFSNQSPLKNSAYGVLYEGAVVEQGGSPMGYFYLDSIAAATAIVTATTHEQLRAVTSDGLNGATVGGLLEYKNYYGLPYSISQFSVKVQEDKQFLYKGSGVAFAGSVTQENYPYTDAAWLSKKAVAKKGAGQPSILATLMPITDWGNPTFCRQQASRYGLPL